MVELVFERFPEHEAQYQIEKAQLNKADRDLACLMSAIERDRSPIPRDKPIPIYEEFAFALKNSELRNALLAALTDGGNK